MEACEAQAIVCISNNDQWVGAVSSAAEAAGAPVSNALSWEQFDSAPMDFAHPECWAYAHMDEAAALLDVRLGNLCRSFPYGVLLELSEGVDASDQQLFAHGFQIFGARDEKMTGLGGKHHFLHLRERCFKFRLEEYKAVPDWLNARYWAHPERFHL